MKHIALEGNNTIHAPETQSSKFNVVLHSHSSAQEFADTGCSFYEFSDPSRVHTPSRHASTERYFCTTLFQSVLSERTVKSHILCWMSSLVGRYMTPYKHKFCSNFRLEAFKKLTILLGNEYVPTTRSRLCNACFL